MKFKYLLTASAMGLSATTAHAQSTGSVDFEETEIIVTGTVGSRGVEGVVLPDTSKAKQVLTQDQLARNNPGQTVLDSINIIPGVSFTNNDAYGSAGGQLFIRGFSQDRVSLTFDGVPLNDSGNYQIYSSQQMDPELIEQVNVNLGTTDVDSPTAAATGSTVNYRTRLPKDDLGIQMSMSVGEFDFFRVFGAVDTGEFTSFGTRAFLAASKSVNDNPYNNYGKIDKSQVNARIYQPLGDGDDFISISGHYNESRNNFFGSLPLRLDTTQTNAAGSPPRVVGPLATNRFPLDNDEREYNLNLCQLQTNAVRETVAQVNATGYVEPDNANTCATEFDRRYNPSNTGNIRGASLFHITDAITLSVDPSYQYVLANGGGTVTAQEGPWRDINPTGGTATVPQCRGTPSSTNNTCLSGYLGGTPYFGRDLNGDGDALDTVTMVAPSNTNTNRYGVIANLRWDISDEHSVRVAFTYDRARHRQTGEVGPVDFYGEPFEVFTTRNALADGSGVIMQKRDRLSYAILEQLSAEYRGEFFDGSLRVNAGIRAPWFTRDLNNYCFTSSDSGFVECFGSATDPRNAQFATFNPTIQGPQQRVLKYDDILPNVGFVFDITNDLSTFANYSKGLQVPGTDALYNAFFFAPNTPSARPEPETTDNFDVGLRYTANRIQAQLVGWYTGYQNRLASAYDPVTERNVYRNLGEVKKYGIDGNISFRPVDPVVFYLFGSWFESEIQDNVIGGECTAAQVARTIFGCTAVGQELFVATAGNREAGAPEYTYGAQVRGSFGPVDLGLTAKRFGGRFIYDTNMPIFAGTAPATGPITAASFYEIYPAKSPAYWLVNLDARINLEWTGIVDERTYLQLNVYNLFDQLYVGNFTSGLNQGNVIAPGQFGGNPGATPFAQIGAPRTISATLNVEF